MLTDKESAIAGFKEAQTSQQDKSLKSNGLQVSRTWQIFSLSRWQMTSIVTVGISGSAMAIPASCVVIMTMNSESLMSLRREERRIARRTCTSLALCCYPNPNPTERLSIDWNALKFRLFDPQRLPDIPSK